MAVRIGIAVGFVVAVGLVAWWWRRREGRFTEAHGRFDRSELGLGWRDRPSAVLVEFFGRQCAPCVTVQERVERIASEVPDIGVVRIDAGEQLALAGRYGVRRVPTLFVADGALRIIWRASGVPSEDAIRAALLGPDWAGRPHPFEVPSNRRG